MSITPQVDMVNAEPNNPMSRTAGSAFGLAARAGIIGALPAVGYLDRWMPRVMRASLIFVAVAALTVGLGCRTADAPGDATNASDGAPPLGVYVWGSTTLSLAHDGSYSIVLREELLGADESEHGEWRWNDLQREFMLEPKVGDFRFAVRRLRVDERHPERLLWIPDLETNALRGAIDYVSFVKHGNR